MVGIHHGLQFAGEAGKGTVVDAAVVELVCKLAEQPGPVPSGGIHGYTDRHQSLNDVDRGSVRGGSSLLFPSPMPAGGRTPLRDRSPTAQRDQAGAPSASRGSRTSCAGIGPNGARIGGSRFGLCRGDLPAALPLAFTSPLAAIRIAVVAHVRDYPGEPPETRLHDSLHRKCSRCA